MDFRNSASKPDGAQDDAYWVALQVRPNHERATSEHLAARNFEHYLPLYRESRRWSDRTKEAESPLFPGYLFCRYEPRRRAGILSTFGVMRILGYDNRSPTAIREEELDAIRRITASGVQCRSSEHVGVGDAVRIQHGSLTGLEGMVVAAKDDKALFAVSVTLLNRSVKVEVQRSWLVSLDPRGAAAGA